MQHICVFCGSNLGFDPCYAAAAVELGRTLAARSLGLVYGGASVGLMGALADAVMSSGGKVVGVITSGLVEKEVAHEGLSELRVVKTMHERKAIMANLADAFVALPGGLGTLDEFFEALTWGQLGIHKKPCALLNLGGYFDALVRFLDHSAEQGFLPQRHREMILVATSIPELFDKLESYVPPHGPKWLAKP
jgi:uncharacterized protein (TIGR00730 family)